MPDSSSAANINVDINQIATDLNGKADKDLMNIDLNNAFSTALNTAGIRTVVETYNSGTSWYRVYSDGWCEQGGYLYQPGAAVEAYHTVTFLKPFINNLYYIQLSSGVGTSGWQYANGASIGYGGCVTRDVFAGASSMQLAHAVGAGNVALFWEVKGYIS